MESPVKRIEPQNPPPPPITAENYRHDEWTREYLRSRGYVLEVPKPKPKAPDDGGERGAC